MAELDINDITNAEKTGIFDRLMNTVNEHIERQYLDNRITNEDYANVYLGSIQAVLAQSIQYGLNEQMTEAQIGGIQAENELKAKQLDIAEQELAIKQIELKTVYTERIIKDKEAAKLGLDNVMKLSEANRGTDPNFVYTPNYEETE